MLPFLRPKAQSGIIVKQMKPSGESENNTEGSKDAGLEAAAADLHRGIEMKDSKKIAAALRAAFEILDSEPHVEGEHINEDSESKE